MPTEEIWIDKSESSTGIITYSTEIMHHGLGKHRIIKERDPLTVETRAKFQLKQWNEQWEKKQAQEAVKQARAIAQMEKEEAQRQATQRTDEAKQRLSGIQNTLHHTLTHDDTVDWNSLKDYVKFSEPRPVLKLPPKPILQNLPDEPEKWRTRYKPQLTWLDKLSAKRFATRHQEAQDRYDKDHKAWKKNYVEIEDLNEKAQSAYMTEVERAKEDHRLKLDAWQEARSNFLSKQTEKNNKIDQLRTDWQNGKREAVEAYCDMVLSNSQYDECCPQGFELEYNEDNRILIVDYRLPGPDSLPTLAEVKYVITRKEFVKKHLPQTKQRKLYDDFLYQIALRTIHELFEADTARSLVAVVFNGFVRSIDKSTGKKVTACVLSVQADCDTFDDIDLRHVDPKVCFRGLSGVGSTKLHSITPVPPLQTLSRDDSRFVADQDVIDELEEGDNLAAMDWEDFEHLIREVFQKEFSGDGGEVKVTQASRDGGVDAIAFDPDPVRGGKIVIQAKRYTNVVGVSAVRDLWGTVMNEGAMKGILVTTSNFGPDAHKFVADKPLTLLSGNHLLHLLDRHGHKAKIDLAEAKRLNDTI